MYYQINISLKFIDVLCPGMTIGKLGRSWRGVHLSFSQRGCCGKFNIISNLLATQCAEVLYRLFNQKIKMK